MAKCHYHPEARGSATCPSCGEHICDRCRMNGTSQRCMTCHSAHSKGGGAAGRPHRDMCTNHADVPVDEKCARCRKPHCPACLNGAKKCFRCALLPPPGENRGTGSLKARGTGSLKKPSSRPWDKPGVKAGAAGLGVTLLVGAVVMNAGPDFFGLMKKPLPPYTGPAKVAILAPKEGATLTGDQAIKLNVGAAEHVERVEVTVDGKYWKRWKQPPFETDWETQIFKNGTHVVRAEAIYRGKKKRVAAQVRVQTKNKNG